MPSLEHEIEETLARTAAGLSPSARVELRQRIDQELSRRAARQPWRVATLAALALGMAGGVAVMAPSFWGPTWYRAVSGSECLAATGDTLDVAACEAAVQLTSHAGVALVLARGTQVDRTPEGLRLRRGRVEVTTAPDINAAPLRLEVSSGRLVAAGATFAAEQSEDEDTGHMVVFQGRVDFVSADGLSHEIFAAGQTFAWPRPTSSPQPHVAPGAPPDEFQPKKRAAAAKPRPLDEVMETLFQLRSQKRYADAARLLRTTLERTDLGVAQRERLSFELGLVLEQSAEGAACGHWRKHAAAFARGELAAAAATKITGCAASKRRDP